MLFDSVSVFLLLIFFCVCIFFFHSCYNNLVNKDVYIYKAHCSRLTDRRTDGRREFSEKDRASQYMQSHSEVLLSRS